jgi:uncharacterized protein YbbK (DUF523 family)
MGRTLKPLVVISRCLCGERCRYDGDVIRDKSIEKLKPFIRVVKVCPEVEMGLPVPRPPIKIFSQGKKLRVIQLAMGKDFTSKLVNFSKKFLDQLKEVDGFILKSRSPSCGLKKVKIYPSTKDLAKFTYGKGFFAKAVLERFPRLAIQDEDTLSSLKEQKKFLRKLSTSPRFKKRQKQQKIHR